MEKLFQALSPFVLILIVLYGFAIMLGKTKELNKELKKAAAAVFQFVVKVISSIITFLFQKLKELHSYCYEKNAAVTVVVELLLILLIVVLIFKK
jgi:uncharacterized membrane protein